MRYLVLSDVHGNLDALDAVLAAAGEVDDYLVLGDLVGYGGAPNEVIDSVRGLDPVVLIRGNHDKVASGVEVPESFNPAALRAARWTQDVLTPLNRTWLQQLPAGPVLVDDLVEVCHGTPADEDEYLFGGHDARLVFDTVHRPVCLFGHTHVPVCYVSPDDDPAAIAIVEPECGGDLEIAVAPGRRYLINPGAVGQPRDGDARAAFAIYDSVAKSLCLRRTPYPVEQAQQRIVAAGLPEVLARRLAVGR